MPRARDPNREKSFELWKEHKGDIKLKDIAEQLGLSDSQIRKWKSQDKWDDQLKGNVTKQTRKTKSNVTNQKERVRQEKLKKPAQPELVIENDELTEKQKLFCLFYLKNFNATKAYQKAYGAEYNTAAVLGHRLLKNDKISKEIRAIKAERQNALFLDAKDVLQKYMDIAFADITDYLSFGSNEYVSRDEDGEIRYDENEQPIYYSLSHVTLSESDEVDGSLITEVKQGKDGISLKLADKMKALEMLAKHTDLLDELQMKKLKEEQVRTAILRNKSDIDKAKQDNSEKPIEIIVRRKGGR